MRTCTEMQARSRPSASRTGPARLGAVGVVVAACVFVAPGAASAQPTNPADGQISAAQLAKDAAVRQVGIITAQLAQAQAGAAAAGQGAQIALQDYQEAEAAYQVAKQAAGRATTVAAKAAAAVQAGRAQVAAFARSSYVDGTTDPGMTALMSADGPAQLLERAALLEAAGAHRTDVVVQLTALRGRLDKASQVARRTVGQAENLKARAAGALSSAISQETSARAQAAALAGKQTSLRAQLQQAQQTLTGLEGARAAAQIFAAQEAAAQAAQQRAPITAPPATNPPPAPNAGGSSSGDSSSGGSPAGAGPVTPPAPSGSAVQIAIAAARSQLGVPYAWGGGGPGGRSMGFGPDAGVVGFDCSGLTQYAYAQAGISISRVARDQYADFSGHSVASSDLQPGDLVFWANGNAYTSIYHVALYIGSGSVIAAPQSGDVVKIEPMWFGSDYFGAVRPTG